MTTKVSQELTLLIHHSQLDKSGINSRRQSSILKLAPWRMRLKRENTWNTGWGEITGVFRALWGLFIGPEMAPASCLLYHKPAPWPWTASQEQMVSGPEVKFDPNAEIANSKSVGMALFKKSILFISPPAGPTAGGLWDTFYHFASVC